MQHWLEQPVKPLSEQAMAAARARQAILTKPPGSLGRLEELAVFFSTVQQTQQPEVKNIHISIFAADHGIAGENVSAFPQVVTTEMIRNFARGGAAISVLAKQLGATLEVIDLGTVVDAGELQGVIRQRIAAGTANFANTAAMDEGQLQQAFQTGVDAIQRAVQDKAHVFIAGDMGIANTTSATALACAVLGKRATELAGPGTGLDAQGVSHKAGVIEQALAPHKADQLDATAILQTFGGFEIAAMCAAYIHAAQQGLPVLVDGFIATSAALLASRIKPDCEQWFVFAHRSHEPGHALMLKAMNARPLLDLQMRLGEGSGAAVAVPLLQQACALHGQMATFEEAGVSTAE